MTLRSPSRLVPAGVATLVVAGTVAWALTGPLAPTERAPHDGIGAAGRSCDRFASPDGHPRARGTAPDPLRSVADLVRRLRPGQVGCLRGGRYVGDVTIGRSHITLRAYPGERAEIVGRLWVRRRAHDDLIAHLRLDGRNEHRLPSPTVNGDRITFADDDVTNDHTSICFDLGSHRYGRASGTVIRASRIHDCGLLPATNQEHGIYVAVADGTRILDNLIYDNADRGIQLYPDAQRTLVAGNVIDGNGEGVIFSGADGVASSHNIVEHNVISNSRIRANVESWYPTGNPVGVGNVVRENCLYGGARGGDAPLTGEGFTASGNVFVKPGYADPAAADFRLPPTSPCFALLHAR